MPLAYAVVAIAATAYGAYESNKAARRTAAVDTAVGDYNARSDEALAAQLDLDTIQNVRTQRANSQVYLSRQAAGYAAAGVLADTGSPLHAQLTNAGRFEQQAQQTYVDSQQKQQQYASAARVGRLESSARADADRATGTLALINGGARIAGQVYKGYDDGIFSVTPARG